jgi:hypothetical protein
MTLEEPAFYRLMYPLRAKVNESYLKGTCSAPFTQCRIPGITPNSRLKRIL